MVGILASLCVRGNHGGYTSLPVCKKEGIMLGILASLCM